MISHRCVVFSAASAAGVLAMKPGPPVTPVTPSRFTEGHLDARDPNAKDYLINHIKSYEGYQSPKPRSPQRDAIDFAKCFVNNEYGSLQDSGKQTAVKLVYGTFKVVRKHGGSNKFPDVTTRLGFLRFKAELNAMKNRTHKSYPRRAERRSIQRVSKPHDVPQTMYPVPGLWKLYHPFFHKARLLGGNDDRLGKMLSILINQVSRTRGQKFHRLYQQLYGLMLATKNNILRDPSSRPAYIAAACLDARDIRVNTDNENVITDLKQAFRQHECADEKPADALPPSPVSQPATTDPPSTLHHAAYAGQPSASRLRRSSQQRQNARYQHGPASPGPKRYSRNHADTSYAKPVQSSTPRHRKFSGSWNTYSRSGEPGKAPSKSIDPRGYRLAHHANNARVAARSTPNGYPRQRYQNGAPQFGRTFDGPSQHDYPLH